jgi:hypothetical protein
MGWILLPDSPNLPKGTEILAVHAALIPGGKMGRVLILGGNEHYAAWAETRSQKYQNDKARLYDVDQKTLFPKNPPPPNTPTVPTPQSDVFCCGHAFAGDGNLVIGGGTAEWRGDHNYMALPFFGENHFVQRIYADVTNWFRNTFWGHAEGGHGHHHYHGSTYPAFAGEVRCWKFVQNGASTSHWEKLGDFQAVIKDGEKTYRGRWYPAMFTLHTGEIITFSGRTDKPGEDPNLNSQPEVSETDATGVTWKALPASTDFEVGMYVRGHVMGDGQVLLFNVKKLPGGGKATATCNPSTGEITEIADFPMASKVYDEWAYASTLLPLLHTEQYAQKVLICNGPEAHIFDNKSKTWATTPARHIDMQNALRRHGCATLLPNGKVFVNGGINKNEDIDRDRDQDSNYEAEIFDPGIDWASGKWSGVAQWTKAGRASVVRNYHSVALLLPDGTVWTAGSSRNADAGAPNQMAQKKIEIYRPDYCDIPNRLRIKQLDAKRLTYEAPGFDIELEGEGEVSAVVLTRCGSSTHAGNFDQRLVSLRFIQQGKTVTAATCKDPKIALPGHYLCWVLDKAGIPCEIAHFIHITH